MPTSVHTFVPQLRSARLFGIQTDAIAAEIARLASGERILRANDNAATVAISETIRARVVSYGQATRNAQDAQDMLRTAEGALGDTAELLQRMRELTLRAANDHLTDADRARAFDELEDLVTDIDLIAERTHYNRIDLLKGGQASSEGFNYVVDLDLKNVINVKIGAADSAALGLLASDLKIDTGAHAGETLGRIDAAIETVATVRSQLGTGIERLDHAVAGLGITSNAAQESQSIVRELDTAGESLRLARDRIMSESSRAMFVQANQLAGLVLGLLK